MKKILCAAFLAFLFAAPAMAQEGGYMADPENRHWSLALYLWGTGLEGDIGVGPFDVPVDLSFTDILKELDFGIFGHVEYHADNNFGFMGDLMYLSISASNNIPFGRVTSDIDMMTLEMALMYNLASRESPFDIFAGFRYWDMDIAIGFNPAVSTAKGAPVLPLPPAGITQTGGTDWTDFMIGARWMPRIGEKWWFSLRADYATADSDTFNIISGFNWRFGRTASLWFGYRYMDVDYEEGLGVSRRALDVTFSGPVAALNFTF